MKRVVGGQLYDTEAATKICEHCFGEPGDFRFEETGLFLTKKGNFFLAGEGGPLSRWGSQIGPTEKVAGNGIEPLDAVMALNFAETADADPEVLTQLFGKFVTEA